MTEQSPEPNKTEREPFRISPMPPLDFSQPLGFHAMHLIEGTDDTYFAPAPIPWEPPTAHRGALPLKIDLLNDEVELDLSSSFEETDFSELHEASEKRAIVELVAAGSNEASSLPMHGPLTEAEAWQQHTGFIPLVGKVDWNSTIPLEEMELPAPGEDAEQDALRARLEAFEAASRYYPETES